jgi:hypothetical protein
MIDKHADANATLCTDEATVYKGIEGYKQLMVNHSAASIQSLYVPNPAAIFSLSLNNNASNSYI